MYKNLFIGCTLTIIVACNFASESSLPKNNSEKHDAEIISKSVIINKACATIAKRFLPPTNYTRMEIAKDAIGTFMRNLPLKPFGAMVKYYNGEFKTKPNVYISVVDLPIGNQDLHQCADAAMNLHAQYLFSQNRLNEIQFKFLGDNKWHNYAKWLGTRNSNPKLFFNYMQQVFSAANSRSLFGQMHAVPIKEAQIGDVFIVTGNPYGHAITIVDACINPKTGKKLFMLAQSYMPAQETQILINPNNAALSPWYDFENKDESVITPEWNFTTKDLRRF